MSELFQVRLGVKKDAPIELFVMGRQVAALTVDQASDFALEIMATCNRADPFVSLKDKLRGKS